MTTISRLRLLGGAGAAMAMTLILTAGPASACSCLPRSLCERVTGADAVFTATPFRRAIQGNTTTYTVVVAAVYKGSVSRVAYVRTATNSATCGVNFTLGTPYVIFGHGASPYTVTTNLCDGDAPRASFTPADIREIIRCAHLGTVPSGLGTAACRQAKAAATA